MINEPKPNTICTINATERSKTTFASFASIHYHQVYYFHFTSTAPSFLTLPPIKLNFKSKTSRITATKHLQEKAHGTRD